MANGKGITLPLWVKEQGEAYARERLRKRKGLKKGSTAYKKAFSNYVQNYAREVYENSLVPNPKKNGSKTVNPWSPKIAKKIYTDNFYKEFTAPRTGLLVQRGAESKKTEEALKSAVTRLTNFYIENIMALKGKDFGYGKASSDAQMRRAMVNRFYRLFVWLNIMSFLRKLYHVDPKVMKRLLNVEFNIHADAPDLRTPDKRAAFIQQIVGALDTSIPDLASVTSSSASPGFSGSDDGPE